MDTEQKGKKSNGKLYGFATEKTKFPCERKNIENQFYL